MAYTLEGVWGKLDRATEHLKTLDAEATAFVRSGAYEARGNFDAQAGEYVLRVVVNEPLPLRFALLVGDAMQNLRAALDHLVCQLVCVNRREPTKGNEFPIFIRDPVSRKDRQAWERDLQGVHAKHRTLIERFQPYQASRPERRPLGVLRGLSNADKHRLVLPHALAVSDAIAQTLRPVPIGGLEVTGPGRITIGQRFEDGAEIMRMPARATGPDPGMQMHGQLPVNISFGEELTSRDGLVAVRNQVRHIIQVFELVLWSDFWAQRRWTFDVGLLGP